RAELVGEEPPAPLIGAERLGPVAGRNVRLHQPPVPRLPERLQRDRLLRPLHRLGRLTRTQARIREHTERTATNIGELAPPLLHPHPLLARQERLTQQRLRKRRVTRRLLEITDRKRSRSPVRRGRGHEHVDPRALGQLEPVTAERRSERTRTVDTTT